MTADRPVLGITLMIGFCAVAPLGDAVAKLLGEAVPLLQLLIVRFAAQALLLLPIIRATGRSLAMSRRVLRSPACAPSSTWSAAAPCSWRCATCRSLTRWRSPS